MSKMSNGVIIDAVKEITVAMVSNSERSATKENGKDVAEFMQVVYDKLTELNKKDQ